MTFHMYITVIVAVALLLAAGVNVSLMRWARRYDIGRHCSGRHTYPWLRHRREVVMA